jgi:hypothetical protein
MAAVGIRIAFGALEGGCSTVSGIPLVFFSRWRGENDMDGNYMFLCGVMWCKFGQQEAGKELLRATNSGDRDMSALAQAMLAKGARRLKNMEGRGRGDEV